MALVALGLTEKQHNTTTTMKKGNTNKGFSTPGTRGHEPGIPHPIDQKNLRKFHQDFKKCTCVRAGPVTKPPTDTATPVFTPTARESKTTNSRARACPEARSNKKDICNIQYADLKGLKKLGNRARKKRMWVALPLGEINTPKQATEKST